MGLNWLTSRLQRFKRLVWNLEPLSKPRFDQIANNQLCPPLDLESFRWFLFHEEHSHENFDFYEFVVAYWVLWFNLTPEEQTQALPVTDLALRPHDLPAFPEEAKRYFADKFQLDGYLTGDHYKRVTLTKDTPSYSIDMDVDKMESFVRSSVVFNEGSRLQELLVEHYRCHQSQEPTQSPLPPTSKKSARLTFNGLMAITPQQPDDIKQAITDLQGNRLPLHSMVVLALERFFSSQSIYEINVAHKLRKQLLENVSRTTHPSIFEPAYREVVQMMERTAQNSFMTWSVRNISPKEAFTRTRTIIPCIISIVVMLALLIHYEVNRWWRLFTLPLLMLSVIFLITNTRGVCSMMAIAGKRDRRLFRRNSTHSFSDVSVKSSLSYSQKAQTVQGSGANNEQLPPSVLSMFSVESHRKSSLTGNHHIGLTDETRPSASSNPNSPRASNISEWLDMHEPLVRRGQLEVLLPSLAISFIVIIMLEALFISIN
ncbi:hypothetical protein IWQ62_001094 [Dispira parvispora]|uniref:RGS domain-containing protein n=1 Tax=Dispira parvispora TaxID=1520584 RepID=A0A9W8AZV2_9FUNG|nr:hypothetical protein IWQ62_001094 [Dispira parvispora]